jgi:spore coat protein A, manganese oxidase
LRSLNLTRFVDRVFGTLARCSPRRLARYISRVRRPVEPVDARDGEIKSPACTLLYVAAGLSVTAALIHLWVMPEHFEEWWGYGTFFLVATLAQGIYGVSLLRWPAKLLLSVGIGGNLAIVGFYVMTRTVGIPLGPHAGHTEAVGGLDVVCTASEVALVMALVVLLARERSLAGAQLASRLLAGNRRWVQYGSVTFAATIALSIALLPYLGSSLDRAFAAVPGASLLKDNISPCFNNSPVALPYTAQMPIPPALEPTTSADGSTDTYQITEERSVTEIIPGIKTPIWGYNGITPGPTILSKKGRPTEVTFTNNLPPGEDPAGILMMQEQSEEHHFQPSSTVVHLHGINASHLDDGYADDGDGHKHLRKPPGESQTHFYPNNEYQKQQTMWYHDHSVHITGNHAYRGLAGLYILKDELEESSGLPGTRAADGPNGYGKYDIPLVLKDVMIANKTMKDVDGVDHPRGTLIYNNCSHMGAFGDVMTMNGKQQPRFNVGNRKYRFRLLNASNARQYMLALRVTPNVQRPVEDDAANEQFTLIGTDQGLFRTPEPTKFVHITPAERFEFVVDFSKYPIGTRVEVVNLLADPQNPKLFKLMAFDVTRSEPDPSRIPPVLRPDADPATPQPDEHPADQEPPSQTRVFEFNKSNGKYWAINGQIFNPLRDDAKPLLNTTEDWILENRSGGWGHPVHLHLGKFKIIDIQGRAPRPGELQGWKDVVWLGPNQRITVRHQFWNFSDRFVFHCHNNSHEDFDMMSQFNVQPNP